LNVGSGSKIDVQTVLKLMLDAITAMSASFGPSRGSGTSSRCRLFVGSLSRERRPANISTSSLWVVTARILSGRGSAPSSSLLAPARMAWRMAFIPVDMRPMLPEPRLRAKPIREP